MDTETTFPLIISVDDHTVEPPTVWQDRLPKKYLGTGPRIVRAPLKEMTFLRRLLRPARVQRGAGARVAGVGGRHRGAAARTLTGVRATRLGADGGQAGAYRHRCGGCRLLPASGGRMFLVTPPQWAHGRDPTIVLPYGREVRVRLAPQP